MTLLHCTFATRFLHCHRAVARFALPPPDLTVFTPVARVTHPDPAQFDCSQTVTFAVVPGPLTFTHQP